MTRHVLKLVTTSTRKEKANVSGQPEENVINTINNTVYQHSVQRQYRISQ